MFNSLHARLDNPILTSAAPMASRATSSSTLYNSCSFGFDQVYIGLIRGEKRRAGHLRYVYPAPRLSMPQLDSIACTANTHPDAVLVSLDCHSFRIAL